MTHNKKPVVIVAVFLGALIVLPVLILMLLRLGDTPTVRVDSRPATANGSGASTVDYELRQLAEHAEKLLAHDLAEALRQGDVTLEYMAGLNREAEKARDAMADGSPEQARQHYAEVVRLAEAQLEALAMAKQARELSNTTYAELKRLDYLNVAFVNTYSEAVETYNEALRSLDAGRFQDSVDGFEMAAAILGDLEARSIQQLGGVLEAAEQAMAKYDLAAAQKAYEEVLRIDPANAAATEGLVMVRALEGISAEVKAIQALEVAGEFETAMARIEVLAGEHPDNPFIDKLRTSIEARILERDLKALLARADAAEEAGEIEKAIEALQGAVALRSDPELNRRLAGLQAQQKAARLETLLASGYNAMKASRYEDARNLYKEAVALAPDSKEARTGYEKASTLYLANIRYSQNLSNALKYAAEGRYPLAARFFNDAMASRPSTVTSVQAKEEKQLRAEFERQSSEVAVTVKSDRRTYVSVIGVLPPDRFRDKELKLFPDVYTIKGTRSGYRDVDIELKVDARKPNQTVEVICTEKQ